MAVSTMNNFGYLCNNRGIGADRQSKEVIICSITGL